MQTTAIPGRRTVSVKLSAPVEWLDKYLAEVVIEEPSAATFFEIGPPEMVVHGGSSSGSLVDVSDRLFAYADKCIKVDNAGHLLRILPLADGKAIKRAILGFFHEPSAEATSS